MGLKISSDDKGVKVIRKDGTSKAGNPYTMYSLMYPFKKGENDYENVFIDAQFRKGVDLANKSKIIVKDGFMTGSVGYINGKNVIKPKIFVMDYEVLEGGESAPKPSADDFLMVTDDMQEEMPFT